MVPTMLPWNPSINESLGKKMKSIKTRVKTLYLNRRKERILKCKISKMNLILFIATNKKQTGEFIMIFKMKLLLL